MTKIRAPGTRHEALTQQFALLGIEAARAATGKSEGHLRHCSDPDEGREISFADLEALCRAAGAAGVEAPLVSFLAYVVEAATPMTAGMPGPPPDPHATLLECVQSVGSLSGTFRDAMRDGELSRAERRTLVIDLDALGDAVEQLRRALHSDPQDQVINTLYGDLAATTANLDETKRQLRREENRRIRLQNRQAGTKGLRR